MSIPCVLICASGNAIHFFQAVGMIAAFFNEMQMAHKHACYHNTSHSSYCSVVILMQQHTYSYI